MQRHYSSQANPSCSRQRDALAPAELSWCGVVLVGQVVGGSGQEMDGLAGVPTWRGAWAGIWPLGHIQGPSPGQHGPDSGHAAILELGLLFSRLRSERPLPRLEPGALIPGRLLRSPMLYWIWHRHTTSTT